MVWHHWWLLSWLNLTLVLWEEKTLDSELKRLGSHYWGVWNGPVEIEILIDLSNSLLLSEDLVDSWRELLDHSASKLGSDLVSNGAHEK